MLQFMSLLPKLMHQQVDEDLRLREQSILVSIQVNDFPLLNLYIALQILNINPFTSSGLFYHNSLDRNTVSISRVSG